MKRFSCNVLRNGKLSFEGVRQLETGLINSVSFGMQM